MSAKSSPEAVAHMLKTTNCHRIIMQPALSALTGAVQSTLANEEYVVDLVELPDLYEIFPSLGPAKNIDETAFTPYPLPEKPRQPDDLVIYIHSSGSTGLPKSIGWTEKIFLHWTDSCKSTSDSSMQHWSEGASKFRYHSDGHQVPAYLGLCGIACVP